MNEVNCIKCKTPYQSEDQDPYYCEECNKTRKQVADEIDAKFANRPKKKVVSDLQAFDELAKKSGTKGFARANDLGIIW